MSSTIKIIMPDGTEFDVDESIVSFIPPKPIEVPSQDADDAFIEFLSPRVGGAEIEIRGMLNTDVVMK